MKRGPAEDIPPALCKRGKEMEEKARILGLDIGGTKCAVTLGAVSPASKGEREERPEILGKRVIPTLRNEGWQATVSALFREADVLLSEYAVEGEELSGIGISCGGPLDSEKGLVLSPPNLPGWERVPVVALTEEHFGAPCRLQNDANACALAEWRWGAAQGTKHAVFLTFGTGLGAGLILNGALYEGASGMAGEVGHIRLRETGPIGYGKEGSFEGFCSGGGIVQIVQALVREELQTGKKPAVCPEEALLVGITTEAAAKAAAEGDPLCRKAFDISAEQLGRGLSLLLDILNPEIIVIGSVFARARILFEERMREVIRAEALAPCVRDCRIEAAALGEMLGDYAALSVARENMLPRTRDL